MSKPLILPVCLHCIHTEDGETCKAFPDGIPDIILRGDDFHEKPLPEQGNDVVFTPED